MSIQAIFSMVVILGMVMGGFVYFLRLAIRKEAGKPDSSGGQGLSS